MKKEDILANCIDEIQAGKCTLEDCLARYPHLGDELRPLLKIALGIQAEEVTPSPEFIQRARKRLLEVMQPSVAPTERRGMDIFGWLKPLALARRPIIAVIIVALLAGGGTTAYAAQGSLPDDTLYPVKMVTEKARLVLTPSDAGKAGLHIAFAGRRVQEMAEMGRRGEAGEMARLATALDYHLEQAQCLVEVISAQGGDIYALKLRLEQSATQQLGILEDTLDEVPEQTKPMIAQALETSGEEYGTAIEAVASTAPAPVLVAGVGTIQIRATDPPPPKADSVLVEVGEIEIHRAAGSDSEWITIVGEPVTFDLLKIAEVQKFLGSQEVPEGTYTQVCFIITKATVIVDGEEYDASVPSGKLKLIRPFQVTEGEMTLVLLDFDGGGSLHVTGGGKFILEPTVKLLVPSTGKGAVEENGEEGEPDLEIKETKVEIEGTVVSFDGNELVLLVAGQEVTIPLSAEVEIEGDLEEGSWVKIEAVAEDGSFLAIEIEVEEEEIEVEEEAEEELAEKAREAGEELAEKARKAEGGADKVREAEEEAADKIRKAEEKATQKIVEAEEEEEE